MWSVECEVWSVKFKFRVRRAQCEVWSVKCEVWSVKEAVRSEKCGVWSVKCGVWSLKFGVRRVQCAVWGVESRGKDTVGTGCLWTIGHFYVWETSAAGLPGSMLCLFSTLAVPVAPFMWSECHGPQHGHGRTRQMWPAKPVGSTQFYLWFSTANLQTLLLKRIKLPEKSDMFVGSSSPIKIWLNN